jgi:hypothetical protein
MIPLEQVTTADTNYFAIMQGRGGGFNAPPSNL